MSKRKALGQGLDALLGPAKPAAGSPTQELDIALLKPNPQQPRTRFAKGELESLAESITTHGIVQPILVRPAGQSFQIIAGERRWRAAQRAGLKKVPVYIREFADSEVLEVALLENIQRQDLSPIEEAKALRTLLEDLGFTQVKLAQRLGKNRASLSNTLRLLELPAKVQGWVDDGSLSAGHAKAILGAPEAKRIPMAQKVLETQMSVRQAEKLAKSLAKDKPAKAPVTTPQHILKVAERLQGKLGSKVQIKAARKGGKITIPYTSEEDLQRLIDTLLG